MAATAANIQVLQAESGFKVVKATITLDTSYPTGGTVGIAALLGLAQIFALVPLHSKGYDHEYLTGTDALRSYYGLPPHSHTENTAAAYTQNAATAAVAGAASGEVANATNLSAVTVDVLVFGR